MSRPSKRPRLHFIPSVSPDPDEDLATARAKNDGLLKTAWEHVFARYERDFEGVGDEISMLDNTIVVDNGHLKSMQGGRDTGTARSTDHAVNSPSKYDGRRILRAMTVAGSEDSEDSISDDEGSDHGDAEEILQSIETIADNLSTDDDLSEDELFNVHPTVDVVPGNDEMEYKSESEVDSLFDTRPVMRSPSIDDLFQAGSPVESKSQPMRNDSWTRRHFSRIDTPETSLDSLPPQTNIDREVIREEIRKALDAENHVKEAKIESAWRIPVRVGPTRSSRSVPASAPPTVASPESRVPIDQTEDLKSDSIWKPASRIRRTKREVVAERNLRRVRAESEDPLQDGFTSDAEQPPASFSRTKSPSQGNLTSHMLAGETHKDKSLPPILESRTSPSDPTNHEEPSFDSKGVPAVPPPPLQDEVRVILPHVKGSRTAKTNSQARNPKSP